MGTYSFDVSEADFEQIVLEGSKQTLVLLDFWATWCGPCKTLKPILEKLAAEYGGKFVLAKVETDANPQLATQYGIRGVPNVKAFLNGQVVDEFSGAIPESQARAFIDRLIPSPADAMLVEAQSLYQNGQTAEALQLLADAAKIEPHNEKLRVEAASIMLDLNQLPETQRLLTGLSPHTAQEDRVQALLARISFAEQAKNLPDAASLQARITANAQDLEARLALANLLIAQQQYEPAMNQLLEIIRRDRQFGDDIGRKTLLTVFNLLGGSGEIVSHYRRLLAAALN